MWGSFWKLSNELQVIYNFEAYRSLYLAEILKYNKENGLTTFTEIDKLCGLSITITIQQLLVTEVFQQRRE